jgi:hypothetical protein
LFSSWFIPFGWLQSLESFLLELTRCFEGKQTTQNANDGEDSDGSHVCEEEREDIEGKNHQPFHLILLSKIPNVETEVVVTGGKKRRKEEKKEGAGKQGTRAYERR